MIRINEYVHYIWVGENAIPTHFIENFEATKKLNPTYEFILWKDSEIYDIISHKERYDNGTIFHKLQLAKYSIGDKFGGIVCDFDIRWKETFDYVYDWVAAPTSMIFPYRESMAFYDRGKQTTFVDDFFFATRPGLLLEYLDYCHKIPEPASDSYNTHPYNPMYLSVWLLSQPNVKYLSHKQIDRKEDSLLAVHDNKQTWNV